MGCYEDLCNRLIKDAQRITEGNGFYTEYFIGMEEADGKHSSKVSTRKVEPYFFDAILKVARKLRELLNEKETKELEQPFGIKGERDKALLNLYRHFNALTGEKLIVGKLGPMHEVLNAIEKIEHARHMEASDEIAKMSVEKLEKFARPMPVTKMSLKEYEEIRAVLDKCEKKEGAKNDD